MFIGDYRIEIISDTEFRLDGGAMFGIVPRVLWQRVCPPDDANRIRLQTNCLFIETPTEKILIETGIGEKWTEREIERYGIFREETFAEKLLQKTGFTPPDISIVVNTHLHFDHAGGNTILGEDKKAIPQFPNARYFVSKNELEHAENPHERDRASYISENWRPLAESGQLELKPDVYEIVEGLEMRRERGHNASMQTFRLQRDGVTLFGFADLIPTRHHLPVPWIMGYDLYPTETLEAKKRLLKLVVKENWLCFFYHDLDIPLCKIKEIEGKLFAQEFPLN